MQKQLVLVFSIVAIVVVVYLYMRPRSKTLYERLGGVYAISAVVNHFSDALIENPVVGRNSANPQLSEWHRNKLDRLPGLKFMRTLWVCSLTGGPFQYSPTVPGRCPFSLENAHKHLKISSDEFDAVAVELAKSLDHFGVPEQEKSEVLAAFAAHKPGVIQSEMPKCPFAITM